MGVAELNEENDLMYLRALIIVYGDAASNGLATVIADDIAFYWNEPAAIVLIDRKPYRLQFDMKGVYMPSLQPKDVYENDNPLHNYFRIEEYSAADISFVDGIGSNTGYFKLSNIVNNSTTAAHEFGHTLGLEHPGHLDIRHMGTPGIMYPRGTITDVQFQYDPHALPGQKGGTLNPEHRRVSQNDIEMLRLHKLDFKRNGKAVVGAFSSVWHEKHLPAMHHL